LAAKPNSFDPCGRTSLSLKLSGRGTYLLGSTKTSAKSHMLCSSLSKNCKIRLYAQTLEPNQNWRMLRFICFSFSWTAKDWIIGLKCWSGMLMCLSGYKIPKSGCMSWPSPEPQNTGLVD
jgi:hypothetical protein